MTTSDALEKVMVESDDSTEETGPRAGHARPVVDVASLTSLLADPR